MSTPPIVVAYDGSPNADDAAALGRLLADASGAPLALAHIYRAPSRSLRHSAATLDGRERFMRRRAEELLSRGARALDRDVAHFALASTTTATGVHTIAEREHAPLVIFGSAHQAPPGRVHPGSATRRLLQVLPWALAVAPVGFRERQATRLETIAVAHDDESGTARRSAEAIARVSGARLREEARDGSELLFVGSGPSAARGHLTVNGSANQLIQSAQAAVVVVPHGQPLELSGAAAMLAA
jgi:nucleotide-binding universal stress UspA family protein